MVVYKKRGGLLFYRYLIGWVLISYQLIYLFLLGCLLGFLTAIMFPATGGYYFHFYVSDLYVLAEFQSRIGLLGPVLVISLRNLIPITVLTFFPYMLAVYREKLGLKIYGGGLFESLKNSLKLISLCPVFAYGFTVYGLFIGYLYTAFPGYNALKFILASMIHGWLEISVMLVAGSTGLAYANAIEVHGKEFTKTINFKAVFSRWLWLFAGILVAGLIETFVTPLFL